MMFKQLGVIGCGLIGGSFALAMKKAKLLKKVVGYSKSPSTIDQAKKLGVIDQGAESALMAVAGSDIVLIAVPVSATESTFKAIRHLIKPGVLVMDAGSTKANVCAAAEAHLGDALPAFVPAHPIAGKESGGVQHAEASLFQGRQVILTPLAQTADTQIQRATDVWSALGSQVLRMTPQHHDQAFAAVSHLPHLLAFAFFQSVASQPAGRDFLSLAGTGFRDFTRIAASEPSVWRDILMANAAEVLVQSQRFRQALDGLEAMIRAGDGLELEERVRQISEARAQWQLPTPPARPAGK